MYIAGQKFVARKWFSYLLNFFQSPLCHLRASKSACPASADQHPCEEMGQRRPKVYGVGNWIHSALVSTTFRTLNFSTRSPSVV